MEPSQTEDELFVPGVYMDDVSATLHHGGGVALTQSVIMKVEDSDTTVRWEESPERCTSLLPPFGAGQRSHLPTPQSPGNLGRYLSCSIESPISSDHLLAGPLCQLSASRPPSRPASTHLSKTPQPEFLASAPKNPFRSPSTSQVEVGDTPLCRTASLRAPTALHSSQIATPSPEITKNRRASVPNAPSDGETMLCTRRAGKRSSSHPSTGQTVLAPGPIISPANSSSSTINQASPELDHSDIQTGRMFNLPHNMAVLDSQHNVHAALRDRESYNLADPFLDLEEGPSRRYPSPPRPRQPHHCTAHGDKSPHLRARASGRAPLGDSIAKFVMSPSDFSESPSHSSPIKAEAKDGEYGATLDGPSSLMIEELTPSRVPTSPRTPPPIGSGRGSVSRSSTPQLADSVFRTPPHVAGGEIERIRQRQRELEGARTIESEKRRPEYLMRTKRAGDDADNEAAERERENALPGLGVTVSPVKGRRLKLYRPEVAHINAMTEIERDPEDVEEPRTPPPLSTVPSTSVKTALPAMFLRAIDWRTPCRRHSSVAWTEEHEVRKQSRLQAFAAPNASGSVRRLKPVEVPGQGRIVIDVTSEKTRELAEAGMFEMPEMDSCADAELVSANGHGAEWPDAEYPWSLQERQRDEHEETERRKRLRWIERFLDRESESEDEDNEGVPGPSTWNQMFDVGAVSPLQKGPHKTVALNVSPRPRRLKNVRSMSFGTANADAREVLLSKKHVRVVAERVRKRKAAEEEEGIVMCVCQGADDGRPMVRCDECQTWYHLVCMDIEDESELGDEWYCWKCVPSAEDVPSIPPSEPTFAPVMPDSPPRAGFGDFPLYQSALQPSPMLDICARAPASPVVHRNRDRSPPRRSRLPHAMGGDPSDPVRGGPSTPYQPRPTDSRLYSTPKFYDEHAVDEYLSFDPTSTPSRGLKFPNAVPITPRRPQTWTPAQGVVSWTTPGSPRTPQFSSLTGSSARSLTSSLMTLEDSAGPLTSPWPEESPIRRPHKVGDSTWPYPPPRRMLDSPLAGRGAAHRPFLPGVEDTPTPRHFHRSKDNGELMTRASHANSPHCE